MYSRRFHGRRGRVPGLAPAFRPTNLPGCVLWLRADLGVTIATGVSQWNDQSGSGNNCTQGTGSAQPTLHASGGSNGQAYLAFASASSQCLNGTANLPNSPVTIVVVAQYSSVSAAQASFATSGGNVGLWITVDQNAQQERGVRCAGVAQDADTNNSATTAWEKWVVTASTAPLQTLRVNGAARTLTPNNSAPSNNTSTYQVGAATSAFFLNGNISEVIVYNSVLNAGQIAQVEAYLLGRYGI